MNASIPELIRNKPFMQYLDDLLVKDFGYRAFYFGENGEFLSPIFELSLSQLIKKSKKEKISIHKSIQSELEYIGIYTEWVETIVEVGEFKVGFGKRKYFICSKCRRKSEYLYVFRGTIKCRKCHHLKYLSSAYHRNKLFDDVGRDFLKLLKMERKFGILPPMKQGCIQYRELEDLRDKVEKNFKKYANVYLYKKPKYSELMTRLFYFKFVGRYKHYPD